MNTESLIKYGFSKDIDKSQLSKVFSDGIKIKELYIDIYSSNPFDNTVRPILMLRRSEKNVSVLNDGKSIIIKMDNNYNEYIMELMLDTVKDSYFKMNFENSFDFILNCQNIFYKVTIFK